MRTLNHFKCRKARMTGCCSSFLWPVIISVDSRPDSQTRCRSRSGTRIRKSSWSSQSASIGSCSPTMTAQSRRRGIVAITSGVLRTRNVSADTPPFVLADRSAPTIQNYTCSLNSLNYITLDRNLCYVHYISHCF